MKLVIKKKAAAPAKNQIMRSWIWECRLRAARMESDAAVKRLIAEQWQLWFGQPVPEKDQVLLEVKLAYAIDFHEKNQQKKKLSESFLQNYKAAMAMLPEGFDKDMRQVMRIDTAHRGTSPEKEMEMKVKRKAAAVKATATKQKNNPNKGPRKGATWYGLFKANHSAKLTDAELAKAMTKAMGDGHTYTEQEVVKNRGFYNFGGFGKNFPKPKAALDQVKAEVKKKK